MQYRTLLEMSYLQPQNTGFPYILRILGGNGSKCTPFFEVSNTEGLFDFDNFFMVSIEEIPKILGATKLTSDQKETLLKWTNINKDHLLKIWFECGTMGCLDTDAGFVKL